MNNVGYQSFSQSFYDLTSPKNNQDYTKRTMMNIQSLKDSDQEIKTQNTEPQYQSFNSIKQESAL